jgi:hypothetical protein
VLRKRPSDTQALARRLGAMDLLDPREAGDVIAAATTTQPGRPAGAGIRIEIRIRLGIAGWRACACGRIALRDIEARAAKSVAGSHAISDDLPLEHELIEQSTLLDDLVVVETTIPPTVGDDDRLQGDDLVRTLRFVRGTLEVDFDFLRGRCIETRVTVSSNGSAELETVNRGEAAMRWVDRMRAKTLLWALPNAES